MAALGVRDWSQFDADADGRVSRAEHRAMLDYLNTSEAHVPADLDAALEAYARDSCAPPGSPGRAWSDDADVSYDETRAEIEARGAGSTTTPRRACRATRCRTAPRRRQVRLHWHCVTTRPRHQRHYTRARLTRSVCRALPRGRTTMAWTTHERSTHTADARLEYMLTDAHAATTTGRTK